MWKISVIFILGLLTAISPFSGLPISWRQSFYVFAGLVIAFLTYLLRREFQILHHTVVSGKDVVTEMYVESTVKRVEPIAPVTPSPSFEENNN
jgi:hypothetical protein